MGIAGEHVPVQGHGVLKKRGFSDVNSIQPEAAGARIGTLPHIEFSQFKKCGVPTDDGMATILPRAQLPAPSVAGNVT